MERLLGGTDLGSVPVPLLGGVVVQSMGRQLTLMEVMSLTANCWPVWRSKHRSVLASALDVKMNVLLGWKMRVPAF